MKIFIFALLIVSVYSYSLKWNLPSPEDHNALLRVLKKRSYGCSSGCASSCNSASSYSCSNCISNNCCQNQCNVCSTSVCQNDINCSQCCKVSCTNTTTTVTTPTAEPVTVPSVPPIVSPSTPIISSSNHSTSHSNTVNTQTHNRLGLSNSISIPINIKNTNVIKNTVTSSCSSGGSGQICDKESVIAITPSPVKPTKPPPSSDGNGNVVIITVPGDQHPHLYPITNLPCYTGDCTIRRPSWSGSFCGGWHGRTHGDYLYLGSTVDYENWGSYGTGYPSTWAGAGYPGGYPGIWTGTSIPWTSGYPGTWTSGYTGTWTSGYPSTWSATGNWGGGYPLLETRSSSWLGSGLNQYSNPWVGYGLGGYSIPWSGFTTSGLGGYTLPWTGLSTATIGSRLGLSGCSNINQDCSLCGSQFYNKFSRNSLAFGSCYGCFV